MSVPATVLVVEENAITRRMIRLALCAEGYRVLEAENSLDALEIVEAESPAVVLLDLILPDAHGFEVLAKMRARPGGTELPIVAVTGFLPADEQARAAAAGFDQILIKPVETAHLVEVVRSYARLAHDAGGAHARGERVLLVDDDPVQLKLTRLQLVAYGFAVETAVDGIEALAAARLSPPDAIICDVLMPRLDGFKLCLAIREDPVLGRTPVVLQSSKFTEEADRALAVKVGANAYVERAPDGTELRNAVLASLLADEPPPFEDMASEGYSEYLDRIVHQLERQVVMNQGLVLRNIRLASSLSVLGAASEAVARHHPLDDALSQIFYRCIDAAGVSVGIFYVADEQPKSFRVHSLIGLAPSARSAADSCFEHPELLELTQQKEALRVPSPDLLESTNRDFLARLGVEAALLTPVLFGDEQLGVLLLGADIQNVVSEDWLGFAKVVGGQLGHAIALGRTFSALEEALTRAKESDRLKTAFLTNISHEVRTPLNVILGYNSLIAERLAELHDQKLTPYLEAVSNGSKRLLQTIQGIIDLSRFETETFEVLPGSVNLIRLVEKSVQQFRAPAEQKRLSLVCQIDVPNAEVRVDQYCLEQSLHQLLDNAIKFTKQGGVVVRLHREPSGALCLSVEDTGVGIDPGYRSHLFKPFSQQDVGQTRDYEGPGIGLALVQRYLDINHAEITLQSDSGKGTTATIRLPTGAQSDQGKGAIAMNPFPACAEPLHLNAVALRQEDAGLALVPARLPVPPLA